MESERQEQLRTKRAWYFDTVGVGGPNCGARYAYYRTESHAQRLDQRNRSAEAGCSE